MKLSGWGRYPVIEATPLRFHDVETLGQAVRAAERLIAYGNGRSYGDSALAKQYAPLRSFDRLLGFDEHTGLLTCEAGVLLSEIIELFLPRGWFLKVTPGTKLITVGGAIASDVHGKNHHVEGCFGETVERLWLMLADGQIVPCSRTENQELWLATCGGMGLTGIIVQASFYLKPVHSQTIEQVTVKTGNLQETFEAFEAYADQPYSVAWIDCLARGKSLGRSVLMTGDFAGDGDLGYSPKRQLSVPCDFPAFALNRWSVKAFNTLYYAKVKPGVSRQRVGVDTFFYPLDAVDRWNRIYGRQGFVQYQFILPKALSYAGLEQILRQIADSGMGSFLAVLKLYGPANEHYLSFPREGYSLALDFKMQPGLKELVMRLDQVVLEHQGRIYLTKDALVSRETFEPGYPQLEKFRTLRRDLELTPKFNSLQAERLGL